MSKGLSIGMEDLLAKKSRDEQNAVIAKTLAEEKLTWFTVTPIDVDFGWGLRDPERKRLEHKSKEQSSLIAVCEVPFHAMAEVEVITKNGGTIKHLWYAHERTTNNLILKDINVLAWTHPGFQLAISGNLHDDYEINHPTINLAEVKAFARAKFKKVLPQIIGIYEPGGTVGEPIQPKGAEPFLKAVKLDMTSEQVQAFISKMDGVMFITGAPGSGKTTVALQRMRFLFDQLGDDILIVHSPSRSRIFLANPNLIQFSRQLLEDHLEIPLDTVELVKDFIARYLADTWRFKHNANLHWQEHKYRLDKNAREAFFCLCSSSDLGKCWKAFEMQIVNRLMDVREASWILIKSEKETALSSLVNAIYNVAENRKSHALQNTNPLTSQIRMDRIYAAVKDDYENAREDLTDKKEKENFDAEFQKWLFYVYDPLDCLKAYFQDNIHEGELRIKAGTAERADEKRIIAAIFSDWDKRVYRAEEAAWLAWLLRFALPEENNAENRFREVPNAIIPVSTRNYALWNHIVIDEAQDLSVPEASLLCSFVDPGGALTISADFQQVVSPVHGMLDAEAFKYGCPIKDRATDLQFPFSKNMRQTKQITDFLRAFYNNTFKMPPPFVANENYNDIKPQVHIAEFRGFGKKIRQIVNVLRKGGFAGSIALIQINEDEDEMNRIRSMLQDEKVDIAPIWESSISSSDLVTSSVERIKGLEFDVCFIIGMDNIERSALKFTENRCYVALSRPSQRLAILCEQFPPLLRGIDPSLYDIFK